MATEIKKIISRRDTAAKWEANNPILAQGEIGVDTTNKVMKIGDGVTPWKSLKGVGGVEIVNDITTGGADKALSAEVGKELERGIVLSVAKATSANYFTNSSLDSNGLMSYENGLCVSEKIALHRDYSGERIKVVYGNVPTTHKILVEYADGIAVDSTTANGDFYRECLINNNVREIQIVFEEGYEAKVFDGANNLIWKSSTKVDNLEEKIETELNGVDNFVEGRYLDENGALQLSESLSVSEIINIDSSLQGKKLVIDYGEFEFNTKVKICVEYAKGNKVDINAQTQGSTTRAVTINSGVDSIRITFAKGHKASVFIQDTGEVIWQAGKTNGLVANIEKNILSFDNGWRTSKIVNPRVDMKKKNLKILEIGNSFTNYPTAYISYIVDNAKSRGTLKRDELDVAFYRLTRTGSSFHDWYKLYHNQDTPSGTTYLFSKAKDELGVINATDETCDVTSNALMVKVLTEYKWDIILIHQRSVYSGECDLWEGHTDAGYLKEFIMILKKYQPQAAIGTTLVHSPSKKINAYKEASTYERWKNIARGVAKMQAEYGVDIVIPWGTALECLRQSSLNDAESELTSDLQHPQYGLVVYTLGLVYFECIYGTRYGVSLLDDTWSRDMSPERANATYPSSMYDINDETRPIAQRAAMLACYGMYSISNPEDYLDLWL